LDADFIRERITQLRIKKGVSEYRMSLDLGRSRSYIQSISSGRSLPAMGEFLQICDYLEVTPREFFDENIAADPILIQKALESMRGLKDPDLLTLIALIERLKKGGPM